MSRKGTNPMPPGGKPPAPPGPPRTDTDVLACQVWSLRDALVKVLNTREVEAKAYLAYQTALENFSGGTQRESKAHLAAMAAANNAENEARLLLATMKTPNGYSTDRARSAQP